MNKEKIMSLSILCMVLCSLSPINAAEYTIKGIASGNICEPIETMINSTDHLAFHVGDTLHLDLHGYQRLEFAMYTIAGQSYHNNERIMPNPLLLSQRPYVQDSGEVVFDAVNSTESFENKELVLNVTSPDFNLHDDGKGVFWFKVYPKDE